MEPNKKILCIALFTNLWAKANPNIQVVEDNKIIRNYTCVTMGNKAKYLYSNDAIDNHIVVLII